MPQQERSIDVPGMDSESILSDCISSLVQLEWELKYAGLNQLQALTPQGWNSKSQQITITAVADQLTVRSETTGGELLDITGKNKKNINAFFTTFKVAKEAIQPLEDKNNRAAIASLREETSRIAAEEQAQAAEVDKAMNLSGSNLYATYTIIALNVVVFLLMAINGAGVFEANGLIHLAWGSNYAPLTLSGDWWRLITNIFIHFGIIHLAMNMYAFYIVGIYLEPMLGKLRYITAYLCTGVLASISSLWWHTSPVNSAGASGAIFGMYGLFLAFLTTNLIPEKVRKALLRSIGIFVVYNLAYGMKGGIDNAAHVGGLVSGFVFGYIYVTGIKKEKQNLRAGWMLPVIIVMTIGFAFSYLQQHKSPAEMRKQVLSEIKKSGYKDNEKFRNSYNKFIELQDKALTVWKDSSLTEEVLNTRLKEISLPAWNEASMAAKEMQAFNVNEEAHKTAITLLQYIKLRQEEIDIFDDYVANKTNVYRLNDVRKRINKLTETLH